MVWQHLRSGTPRKGPPPRWPSTTRLRARKHPRPPGSPCAPGLAPCRGGPKPQPGAAGPASTQRTRPAPARPHEARGLLPAARRNASGQGSAERRRVGCPAAALA
eukprot:14368744-Alexandrium_andersonii.AAC.1